MLTRVDRIQVVVAERRSAATAFARLLDAELVREDRVRVLGAQRTVLRLGASEVELLAPDGSGIVADYLAQTKGGLFAAGFATHEFDRLRRHLEHRTTDIGVEGTQLFLSPTALGVAGLRAVISPDTTSAPHGNVRSLYEVTLLVQDVAAAVEQTAATFALDRSHFVPIRSAEFGYEGTLTLFHPDRLDRIEIITPTDAGKTMGRFFAKRGPALYMCYAEADDLTVIRTRLLAHARNDWTGARDARAPTNLFIHPRALGGIMLGISYTTVAWTWSGHPERVVGPRET